MKILKSIIICFILLAVTCRVPKRYKIDYDLPLEPQYSSIISEFKLPLENYMKYASTIPGVSVIRSMTRLLTFLQPKQLKDDISMIARLSGYDYKDIALLNLSYEILCSSIIVRNRNNTVFMGRNLDFDGAPYLAALSYEIEAWKGGKHQYTAAGIVGVVSFLNAVRPGKYAISINQRTTSSKLKNLIRLSLGYKNPVYYLKEIVEKAETFDAALELMKSDKLTAPCYFIISGVNTHEGAVVARDWNKPVLVDYLTEETWFLVQTNYDRNQEDPLDDYRRIPAEKKLTNIGKDIDFQMLYDRVMRENPNFNGDTIYTTIQSAENGYFNTTVYYDN